MCMKNVSTDLLFFQDANNSKINDELLNLYGLTKDIPVIEVTEKNENTLIIPSVNFMLSVNATEKDIEPDINSIDFDKTYRICIRVTETTSGQCVDTVQFDIRPCDEEIVLCRRIYTKKMMCRLENIIVTKPPQGKDLCVFKVLIQELKDGKVSEDEWIAQSMHPVRMIIEKSC